MKDEYGREIVTDEYGSYSIPSHESLTCVAVEYDKFKKQIWLRSVEARTLKDKMTKVQDRKGGMVGKRFRNGIADGRDLNHYAPNLTKQVDDYRQAIATLSIEIEELVEKLRHLRRDFGAEMVQLGII